MLHEILRIFLEQPVAQTVWIIATVVMTYSGTIKDDQKMLYWLTASMIIWSLHFFLLDSTTAGLLYLYMFIRNLFFFKWPKNKWLFIIAAIIPFIILYFSYENHTDIVATMAPLVFIYSVYFLKGWKLRVWMIIISLIWIYYSWFAQSIGWVITEVIYLWGLGIWGLREIQDRKKL